MVTFNKTEYARLKNLYGKCSSWAVWNPEQQADASIIKDYLDKLHTRYVFCGLNISKPLSGVSWQNFHGGKHDRKLMQACNITELRGSYLTDIFKYVPTGTAKELRKHLKKKENNHLIAENVEDFIEEMANLKANSGTTFILLGNDVERYFNAHFKSKMKYHDVIKYRHYASRGTDEAWVAGLLEILGIKEPK